MADGENAVHTSGSGNTRLTHEQLQRSVDRLAQSKRVEVCLPPLIQDTYITPEQLQRSVRRLYDESVEARRSSRDRQRDIAQSKVAKDVACTTKPISPSEEDELVQRLYNDALKQRETMMQALHSTETQKLAHSAMTQRATDLSKTVSRLYSDSMSQRHDRRLALFKKYVLDRRGQPLRQLN